MVAETFVKLTRLVCVAFSFITLLSAPAWGMRIRSLPHFESGVSKPGTQLPVRQHQVEDFLCTYFGISPLLKELPRDVQFLISRNLCDFFIEDCFVMERPQKLVQFESGSLSSDNHIRTLAFSPDNSVLVFCTETVCRCADIRDNGQSIAPVTVAHQLPENNYLNYVACNTSAGKILILGSSLDAPFDTNSFFIELFLRDMKVVWQRSRESYNRPNVRAVCYTSKGEIVGALKNRDVFVLNKKGACIFYHKYPFHDTLSEYDRVFSVRIFPHVGHVLFQTESHSGGSSAYPHRSYIIDCHYMSGDYSNLLKCSNTTYGSKFSASSSMGVFLLQTEKYGMLHPVQKQISLQLYNPAGDLLEEIPVPGERFECSLSPDGEYILCVRPYLGIYRPTDRWNNQNKKFLPYLERVFIWHVPTKRVIAYIDAQVTIDLYSKICFSDDGKLFAHSLLTDERFVENSKENENLSNVIGVWKINQLWKELRRLHEGQLLLEHALFILF